MTALKLTQIGNSVGVILPKETLARFKLVKGDTVFITDAVDGIHLTPYDPDTTEQLKLGVGTQPVIVQASGVGCAFQFFGLQTIQKDIHSPLFLVSDNPITQ